MVNFGDILRINLTNGSITKEVMDETKLRKYLGGRGLGTRILFDETPAGIDPLGEQNKLIFAIGPMTGRGAPTGNRYMVVTKSPLTGFIASSNSGGFWGTELARAGHAALIIEGKAASPCYLWIKDGEIEIRDASSVWGLDSHETTDKLLEMVGDPAARVSCISKSGEQLSKLAAIMNEKDRAAGRSGVGAVMGSKNLKAIVVRGTGKVEAALPEKMKENTSSAIAKIKANPVAGTGLPTYGTACLVNVINAGGAYPYKNWQSGYMDPAEADKQSGETLTRDFLVRKSACFGCPIACGRVTKMKSKPLHGEGPEYETIFAFGACCGVADMEPILEANYICNEQGIDTIGAGVTVAAAMELYEKGYLPKADLEGGPELRFGDTEAMVYWTRKMARAEGKLGKLMGDGSYRLCEAYGHPELSMTVKKQEMPAYDARGIQGIGITYATSNRGACHVRGYTIAPEMAGLPVKLDPHVLEGKPEIAKIFHDLTAAIDSIGMCLFTSFALGAEDYAALIAAGTKWDMTAEELLKAGERVWNLEKQYNIREGWKPEDDRLPDRLVKEPLPEGPSKGMVSRLSEMLPKYYALRGWDEKGYPTQKKLTELGL